MKKLYPIGTIVSIQGLKQKIMICGLYMETTERTKVFDYAALDFPIGYSPDGNLHVFDNEHIIEVHHMGWPNDEHCIYVENLMLFNNEGEYATVDVKEELEEQMEVYEEDDYTQL